MNLYLEPLPKSLGAPASRRHFPQKVIKASAGETPALPADASWDNLYLNLRSLLSGLVGLVLLCSCGRQDKGASVASDPPEAGALFSLSDGEGGFRAAKVLAVEDEIVFVNLYSQRWTKRPTLEAARKASAPSGLAYSAESFSGMQPVRLEPGEVSPDELGLFEQWKRSKRAVF